MKRNPSDNKAWQRLGEGRQDQTWDQKWATYEERNKAAKAHPRGPIEDASSTTGNLEIDNEGCITIGSVKTWTRETDGLTGKLKHISDECDAMASMEN